MHDLIIYTAEPGTASEDRLKLLASWQLRNLERHSPPATLLSPGRSDPPRFTRPGGRSANPAGRAKLLYPLIIDHRLARDARGRGRCSQYLAAALRIVQASLPTAERRAYWRPASPVTHGNPLDG